MKKRIKVFAAGSYPQGEFSESKVNEIFSGITKADGIYAHSSKWAEKGEQPLTIGEFSNFKVENGIATADVEFNDKGQQYYNDGVIRGVSVEIRDNKLSKIALLPIGVKPAVAGAEFEEEDYALLEFEEGGTQLDLNEILVQVKTMDLGARTAIVNAIFGSLTNDEKEGIRQVYWADFEKKETTKPKTEEEIRAEVSKEFEDKAKGNTLKELAKKKFIPCMQPIIEFAIDKSLKETGVVEFEENGVKTNITYFENLSKTIEKLPDAANFNSKTEQMEFETTGEESIINKTAKETREILGGK